MDEPIAIIGLDARFPGDGDTAERFYESLLAGRSARTEVPSERYNAEAFWHPDGERSGSTRARCAHYLKGSIAAFDAPFFSITPAEARSMDPQQRGMLESVYKALENAGITLSTAAGTQTGVYVGCFTSDYNDITIKDLDSPSKYAATGTEASMLSNRVSWFFDFRGPSMTIDTACSSSLVAAHEACMSLKLREISMAVVGGCNLILSPEMALKLGAAGVLGPDGKSYSFDHRGNGYSRGEGFGVLVLKRVSDAIRDGDVIRAVIRNSSTNSDGRSPGITQPTKAAQAALIKHVYSRAGLDPSLTRFFEAHGTGTPVGDPIEASAISEVFTPHRSAEEPLYVGALKSNVGHLEGAAGVASIIKGVFTLERGIIPPNIWFEKRNPKIQESWHLKFPTEATAWPQAGLRRMSINSFGIGGSNAHVVMDDAFHFLQKCRLVGKHRTHVVPSLTLPPSESNDTTALHRPIEDTVLGEAALVTDKTQLFVLSSHDQDGVSRVQEKYHEFISSRNAHVVTETAGDQFFKDLSHTLSSRRTLHAWRAFSVANSSETLQKTWREKPVVTRALSNPQLAFIFTGQGAQWPAMGVELMVYPAFRASILAADEYLGTLGCPWSLTYELSKDATTSRIDDPEFCQPICTALQIALVDLLSTWSIYPDAITGHSSGEVVAAYSAGAISQEAAWKVAYFRGKLSAKLCNSDERPSTSMAAVGLNLAETQAAIERINQAGGDGTLEVACMNSWQSHTVSGSTGKIDALVAMLSGEKKFARKLNVKIAYHSQYMKAMADEYLALMGELEPGTTKAGVKPQFYSSVLGATVSNSQLRDASYWVQNLVSPVRFCDSVTQLLKGSSKTAVNGAENVSTPLAITDVLEIGPHSALKGPFVNISKQAGKTETVAYHSILRRNAPGIDCVLETAGSLFCRGHDVNLHEVNDSNKSSTRPPLMLTDLPSYSFNHSKEYWVESKRSKDFRLRAYGRHELLGAPVLDWNKNNAVWRNYIRISENPWLEDHKVSGEVLYPAAGMLVMAIEASRQLADASRVLKGFRFKDVSFHLALHVPDDAEGIESHFHLGPQRESSSSASSRWSEFQLYTWQDGEWREHCYGLVQTEYETENKTWVDGSEVESSYTRELKDAQVNCTAGVSVEKLYHEFHGSGLDFGPTFQTLSEVQVGPELQVLATVNSTVAAIAKQMPYQYLQPHLVHPATLDGVIHANLAPLVLASSETQQTRVPIYAKELWVSASPHGTHDAYKVTAQAKLRGRSEAESSVTAVQAGTGQPMIVGSGLVFKTLPASAASEAFDPSKHGAFNIEWKPDPTLLNKEEASQVFGLPFSELENPSDWMEDCEMLCFLYMKQYLGDISPESREKLDWHHKRYVAWMEHIRDSNTQHVTSTTISELEERVKARGTPEGKLIIAVGQALPEMLSGARDPLDVIFKDKIAEEVYRHGLGSQRCYVQLCNYLDALAHKNPKMRILEIGAGTGGATRPIMETLTKKGQRFQHYDFTDISPSFFEKAREIFSDHVASMNFKVLNVENSPAEQGFTAGDYDLVVAANVLHATKKIDQSLEYARSLLKPGGKLLLFEITSPTVLLGSFCFGVLPGWWLSEDPDRVWGPLMSTDSWDSHLLKCGFSGLDAIFQDFPGSAHQMSSILVSTVPTDEAQVTNPVLIVRDVDSPLQHDVAKSIQTVLSPKFLCEEATLEEASSKDVSIYTCIVLHELEAPILKDISEDTFDSIKWMVNHSKALLWLSRGGTATAAVPDLELVTGLARVARAEREDLKFATLSFDQGLSQEGIVAKTILALQSIEGGSENSFRVSDGITEIPRLIQAEPLTKHVQAQSGAAEAVSAPLEGESSRGLTLQVEIPGQLDTIVFGHDKTFDTPLSGDEVEFKTMACGINHCDLASVLGKIEELNLGLEASGVVTRVGPSSRFQVGDRVFGLSLSGTIKTYVRSVDGFLAKMPPSLKWTEAASIPFAYTTAYAVLYERCAVQEGDTLLVHGAASSVGQAAIHLAKLRGASIIATVSNSDEKAHLEKTYGLPQDRILSNFGSSLNANVRKLTNGRGVDVILNFLDAEALQESLDCVASFGRIVEIGLEEREADTRISLSNLPHGVCFESFDLVSRAIHDTKRAQNYFQRMVELLYEKESVLFQLPVTVQPFSKVQDALRQIQSGVNLRRVVLEPHNEDIVRVLPSRKPTAQFRPNASYVIAGGLGGLGRSIARWMASRGAKNLILLSRRGPVSEEAQELVKELSEICDNVVTPACDITDSEAFSQVIAGCQRELPPIRGCVQGSMVLRDNRLEDMTHVEWTDAVRSKVHSSWSLHNALGNNLDFFILLSSTVGITGNPEQANYAAGNTFQDALARHLASQGLNAVSLNLPVIQGVGFVAEKPELMDYMRSTGWAYINEEEFHSVLDYYCRARTESLPLAESQAIPRFWLPQETAAEGYQLPAWRHSPMFNHLSESKTAETEKVVVKSSINHAALLATVTSIEAAQEVVLDALLLKLSRVLSVELSNLDSARPLHAYGIDSLVAVELRSWLFKALGAEVSIFDITSKPSIKQLANTATEKSRLTPSFGTN